MGQALRFQSADQLAKWLQQASGPSSQQGQAQSVPAASLAIRPTPPTVAISAQQARAIARAAALDAWRRMRFLPVPAWRSVCREVRPTPMGRLATGGGLVYVCRGWLAVGMGRQLTWEAVVDGATGRLLGISLA